MCIRDRSGRWSTTCRRLCRKFAPVFAEGTEPPSSLRSLPPEAAALPSGRPGGQRAGFVRAMPWLFVLIWSTGFVVARLAMPHAPPFGFLTCLLYTSDAAVERSSVDLG